MSAPLSAAERRAYNRGVRDGLKRRDATTPVTCYWCGRVHDCPGKWVPGTKRVAGAEAVPVPTRAGGGR